MSPLKQRILAVTEREVLVENTATIDVLRECFLAIGLMEEFVERVECGEVRSRRTYAAFRQALGLVR